MGFYFSYPHPLVEAGRIGAEMPLTENGGRVTRLLQQLRKGLLSPVETAVIGFEAIDVAMFAGQHTGATGTADGIGAKIISEDCAFLGNPIDVGRLVYFRAIGADRLLGVVVRKKKDDVRLAGLNLTADCQQSDNT